MNGVELNSSSLTARAEFMNRIYPLQYGDQFVTARILYKDDRDYGPD